MFFVTSKRVQRIGCRLVSSQYKIRIAPSKPPPSLPLLIGVGPCHPNIAAGGQGSTLYTGGWKAGSSNARPLLPTNLRSYNKVIHPGDASFVMKNIAKQKPTKSSPNPQTKVQKPTKKKKKQVEEREETKKKEKRQRSNRNENHGLARSHILPGKKIFLYPLSRC